MTHAELRAAARRLKIPATPHTWTTGQFDEVERCVGCVATIEGRAKVRVIRNVAGAPRCPVHT